MSKNKLKKLAEMHASTDAGQNSCSGADAAPAAASDIGNKLKAFAVEQLNRAIAYLAQPGKARHEGIHEGRKCIRRARATLALAACTFKRNDEGARAARLDFDLGQLCRGLSPLRDAQALIEALSRLSASAPDVAAVLPDAITAAKARRDQLMQVALRRNPDFLSRRDRLAALVTRLQRLAWQDIGASDVGAALTRSMRRVEKAHRKANRHPELDEIWHTYRRRLRRLRQQDSLIAAIKPELRPAVADLEQQAERLGESQDDALLLKHCGKRSPFAANQRKILSAIAGARLRHMRSQ